MPKRDAVEPRLSIADFDQRCRRLAEGFSDALGQDRGEIAFTPDCSSTNAIILRRSSEHIGRNAGKPHRVVRLCPLGDDVFAWVGYRESWRKQVAEQRFRFFDAGFTVHIGRVGELAKPQLLRSEWISPHNGGFTNRAGHPHWQVDVLESARARPIEAPARSDAAVADAAAQEFAGPPAPPAETDLLLGLTIERVHLASAALWWQTPSPPIAHQAETVADLNRWVLGCIAYLRQEMERCVIVQA